MTNNVNRNVPWDETIKLLVKSPTEGFREYRVLQNCGDSKSTAKTEMKLCRRRIVQQELKSSSIQAGISLI